MTTIRRVLAILVIVIGVAHGLWWGAAGCIMGHMAGLTVLSIFASIAPALVLVVSGIILYRAEAQESETEPADGWFVLVVAVTYMGALLAAFLLGKVVAGDLTWLSDIANSVDSMADLRRARQVGIGCEIGVAIVAIIPALVYAFRHEGQQRLHARIAVALFLAFSVHWAGITYVMCVIERFLTL